MDKIDDLEIDPARLITRDPPGCPEWARGKMQQIKVRASYSEAMLVDNYDEGWLGTSDTSSKPFLIMNDEGTDSCWYNYVQPVLKPVPWEPKEGEQVIAWNDGGLLHVGLYDFCDDEKVYVDDYGYDHIARMRPIDASTTPEDIMRGGDWK